VSKNQCVLRYGRFSCYLYSRRSAWFPCISTQPSILLLIRSAHLFQNFRVLLESFWRCAVVVARTLISHCPDLNTPQRLGVLPLSDCTWTRLSVGSGQDVACTITWPLSSGILAVRMFEIFVIGELRHDQWRGGLRATSRECLSRYSSKTRNFWEGLFVLWGEELQVVLTWHRTSAADKTRKSSISQHAEVFGDMLAGRFCWFKWVLRTFKAWNPFSPKSFYNLSNLQIYSVVICISRYGSELLDFEEHSAICGCNIHTGSSLCDAG
jgi:hypothetical protein